MTARLLILFSCISSVFSSAQTNVTTLRASADAAFREGMRELAQARYDELLALPTENAGTGQQANAEHRLHALERLVRLAMERNDSTAAAQLLENQLSSIPSGLVQPEHHLLAVDVLQQAGKVAESFEVLSRLEALELTEAQRATVLRLRARGYLSLGKKDEALDLYTAADQSVPASFRVGIELDWAAELLRQGSTNEAANLLTVVQPEHASESDQQLMSLLRADLDLRAGNASNALERLAPFLGANVLPVILEKSAYDLQARAMGALGRNEEALEAWKGMEALSLSATELAHIRVHQAGQLVEMGMLSNATALLRTQIAVLGDDVLAARVQEELAEALVREGEFEQAVDAYQAWLDVFSDSAGTLRAALGKAWALEKLEQWDTAARTYEKVVSNADAPAETRARAELKWADMEFLGGNPESARTRYQAFVDGNPGHEEVPRAMFQAAVCLSRMDKPPAAALDELDRLRSLHPDSPYAERALLEKAGVLNRALRLEQALGLYGAYLERYPQGSFVPEAMMDKGLTAYRLGLYELALRMFSQVMEGFPEHERAEQAYFMRGWAMYLSGDDEEALAVNREFLWKFPESRWAPDARFWVAEFAYNHGKFLEAEREFVLLSEQREEAEEKAQACYFAARSAFARKDYERARQLFDQAIELAPASANVADRLFYKGDALTELDRFDEAIVVFDALIAGHPESWLVHAAWGRKGDCQFTLGETNKERYEEALDSYRTLLESSQAEPGLKLQASYKLARTLERMERVSEALLYYQDAVVQYMDGREALGVDAKAWFVRAATDAAQVYEREEKWREAIGMYEKLVDAAVPQAEEARKRITNLRIEHRIFF